MTIDDATIIRWMTELMVAVALVSLALSLRAARHQFLVDNLPTSKTSGVFIGLVELKGKAEAEQPLTSYLAEASCVYYRYTVQERWSRTVTESYTDSDGRTQTRNKDESGWKKVDEGGIYNAPFYLKDDRGEIRILPRGAKVEPQTVFSRSCGPSDPVYYDKGPSEAITDSDNVREFKEEAIRLHAPLFVVGRARQRADIVAAEIAAYEARRCS